MTIGNMLYEGKAKKVFATDKPDQVVQYFKDDATAFNAQKRGTILEKGVQDVPLSVFECLEANDILFIDSTHVCKTGSDVNYLFFEVLPRLKPGVVVHVHDIFHPFEYPKRWVMEGRAWNEVYLLRAFLQFNSAFKVLLFANYLSTFHRESLVAALPMCQGNFGGNIWLQRV